MRRFIVLLTLISSASAYADDWIFIVRNKERTTEWQGLKGSYELRQNKNGDEIVVWTEKEIDKKANKITLGKLYVKTSDCLQKQGKAVSVNMDGDFRFDFDFIFGVESVGAYRAEQLCGIYIGKVAENMGKSL